MRESRDEPIYVRIKRERRRRNWTTYDLSEKCGWSKSTIERIERGEGTSYQAISDILEALGAEIIIRWR